MSENTEIKKQSNGLGLAGFIVAIVAIVLCWIPMIGWVIAAIALILSAIGLTKKPKGLAIAGLIIAIIAIAIGIYSSYVAAQVASEFTNGLQSLADSLSNARSMMDTLQ